MKLTRAQKEVLQALDKKGPLETSTGTHYNQVHGGSAEALIKKGLVRRISTRSEHYNVLSFKVEITEEGRKALADA